MQSITKQQAIIQAMTKKEKTPVAVRVYAVVLVIVLAAILAGCESKPCNVCDRKINQINTTQEIKNGLLEAQATNDILSNKNGVTSRERLIFLKCKLHIQQSIMLSDFLIATLQIDTATHKYNH